MYHRGCRSGASRSLAAATASSGRAVDWPSRFPDEPQLGEHVMTDDKGSPPVSLWAYAYQIDPPEVEERLRSVRTLLDDEHARALCGARTWVGRVVAEERITHILVVSESPDRGLEVNTRLEAELKKLRVGFSITAPMRVSDSAAVPPPGEEEVA